MISSLTIAAALGMVRAAIDPVYATNLTLYHSNQREYSADDILNMDTGDIPGDAYFTLRQYTMPLECALNPKLEDCVNPEDLNATDLVVTKLLVEVDSRFGVYGHCNVCGDTEITKWNCTSGTYVCGCNPDWHDSPCNETERFTVGVQDLGARVREPQVCNTSHKYDCWRQNLGMSTGGVWFSTQDLGQCDKADPAKPCAWRVVEAVKRIEKTCQDRVVERFVEAADTRGCFQQCSQPLNTTDSCYIGCFYDTLLGPGAGDAAPLESGSGLDISAVLAEWEKPFLSSDDTASGCPDVDGRSDETRLLV